MLSSMYSSSIRSSSKLADQRSPFVPWAAARRASGRASRRQRLSAACVERVVSVAPGFAPRRVEETRRALRLRGAGMMTFGEAAGESLHFTANAIAETTAMAGFAPVSFERAAARNEIGVSDTQNVIAYPPTPHPRVAKARAAWSGGSLPRAVCVDTL